MMEVLQVLSAGIGTTLAITVGAFALGAVLAVPLLMLRRSAFRPGQWLAIALVETIRSVPPIVWLFVIYYIVGVEIVQLDTFQAAILGFAIISAAYISEIYRAAIEAVPQGQWEAAEALGLKSLPIYARVILPQAVLLTIPPASTFLIGLLKDSAVASVIGAADITFLALQTARSTGEGLTVFLAAAALYLLLSVPIAAVARGSAGLIERKLALA
jgi:polar amino acid transport system permease protein